MLWQNLRYPRIEIQFGSQIHMNSLFSGDGRASDRVTSSAHASLVVTARWFKDQFIILLPFGFFVLLWMIVSRLVDLFRKNIVVLYVLKNRDVVLYVCLHKVIV
jgi:hypothetical protein